MSLWPLVYLWVALVVLLAVVVVCSKRAFDREYDGIEARDRCTRALTPFRQEKENTQ